MSPYKQHSIAAAAFAAIGEDTLFLVVAESLKFQMERCKLATVCCAVTNKRHFKEKPSKKATGKIATSTFSM